MTLAPSLVPFSNLSAQLYADQLGKPCVQCHKPFIRENLEKDELIQTTCQHHFHNVCMNSLVRSHSGCPAQGCDNRKLDALYELSNWTGVKTSIQSEALKILNNTKQSKDVLEEKNVKSVLSSKTHINPFEALLKNAKERIEQDKHTLCTVSQMVARSPYMDLFFIESAKEKKPENFLQLLRLIAKLKEEKAPLSEERQNSLLQAWESLGIKTQKNGSLHPMDVLKNLMGKYPQSSLWDASIKSTYKNSKESTYTQEKILRSHLIEWNLQKEHSLQKNIVNLFELKKTHEEEGKALWHVLKGDKTVGQYDTQIAAFINRSFEEGDSKIEELVLTQRQVVLNKGLDPVVIRIVKEENNTSDVEIPETIELPVKEVEEKYQLDSMICKNKNDYVFCKKIDKEWIVFDPVEGEKAIIREEVDSLKKQATGLFYTKASC